MANESPGYRAFISYSHADKACADWLHRELEAYRLPPQLVGTRTDIGNVPARLAPIFCDRDELPAAGDLSDELRKALERSQFLIVIVSPAAAKSRWVDEEVRQFKALHGEGRVLALIASGLPGGAEGDECFPPSLRFKVDAAGTRTAEPAEPIAADLREHGDGKRLAKLKLVAGLTGLPLDALVQREAARRQKRLAVVAVLAVVLAVTMSVLALTAVRGQAEAERQRAEADGLVEFMLTDLRSKLEPVGRLEIFESVGERALAYYAKQDLDALDADALGRRARALHLVGEVAELRGNSDRALEAFRESELTTGELLAREPDVAQRIFDHAQSVYWVGFIAWQRKDMDEAERRFLQYDTLADQLVAMDPGNADWQVEKSSSVTNLGVLYQGAERFDDAVANFRTALAMAADVAAASPDDRELRWSLAQSHAWLADALMGADDYDEAIAERQREIAIYRQMLAADARDARAHEGRSVALIQLSNLSLLKGAPGPAVEAGETSLASIRDLLERDPANRLWQDLAIASSNQLTEALVLAGRWQEAEPLSRWALEQSAELVALDPSVETWRTNRLMPARWLEIAIASARGDSAVVVSRAAAFEREFAADQSTGAGSLRTAWVMVVAVSAAHQHAQGDQEAARARLDVLRASLPERLGTRELAVISHVGRSLSQGPGPADVSMPASAQGYDPGAFLPSMKRESP